MNKKLLSLCFFIFISTASYGADYQKGLDAYNKGDYQAAYDEWYAQATEGDRLAQYALGCMHENG